MDQKDPTNYELRGQQEESWMIRPNELQAKRKIMNDKTQWILKQKTKQNYEPRGPTSYELILNHRDQTNSIA